MYSLSAACCSWTLSTHALYFSSVPNRRFSCRGNLYTANPLNFSMVTALSTFFRFSSDCFKSGFCHFGIPSASGADFSVTHDGLWLVHAFENLLNLFCSIFLFASPFCGTGLATESACIVRSIDTLERATVFTVKFVHSYPPHVSLMRIPCTHSMSFFLILYTSVLQPFTSSTMYSPFW